MCSVDRIFNITLKKLVGICVLEIKRILDQALNELWLVLYEDFVGFKTNLKPNSKPIKELQ